MSSTHSPFLSLPREIRDMIYGYLLASETYDTMGGADPEATIVIGNIHPFPGLHTTPLTDLAHQELQWLGQNPMEEERPISPRASKLCQTITGRVETSYERQGGVLHPSVLYVNQQIYDEAEQILYSKNTFRFKKDSTEALAPFLKDRSAAARAAIKSLRVRLWTSEEPDSFAYRGWDKFCTYIAEELHLRILRLDLDTEDKVNDSTDPREFQFRWHGPTSGWVRSLIKIQTLPSLDICTQWGGVEGYQSEVNWNLLDHLESNREVPSRTPAAAPYGRRIYCGDSLFKDWHVDRKKADPTYRAEITEYYKQFHRSNWLY
ncbi:MAG: hypothetical protein M1835_001273 [Candelina submexicana]|nr:MAG: hypothetical protein M1835_001273 [Candelina submexicana]